MNNNFSLDNIDIRYKIKKNNNKIEIIDILSSDSIDALLFAIYSSKNNIQISQNTIDYFRNNKILFKDLNIDYLRAGLINIISGEKPSNGFEFLRKIELLQEYYPWLYECYGVLQNEYHAYDVYYHLIYSCDAAINELPIRLSALFHDIGKVKAKRKILIGEDEKDVFYNHEIIGSSMTYQILKKLKFDKELIIKVTKLIRYHMFHYTPEWSDNAIRRFIRNIGDNMKDLFKLRNADRSGNGKKIKTPQKLGEFKKRIEKIIEYDNRLTVKDLNINGNDLMNILKIKQGPLIGKILKILLEYIENDINLNNKNFLIEKANEIYNSLIINNKTAE